MLVRFWGTRGSIAKPGLSTVRYGGNTSCVELRSSSGTLVVLDCGTGAQGLGQALVSSGISPLNGHLLIGHTHWDHIQGFPFFEPLFKSGNEWHIYGPRGVGFSLRESLSGQMQSTYFPITLKDLGATLHYHDLVEGTLEVGDIRVTTQYLNRPASMGPWRLLPARTHGTRGSSPMPTSSYMMRNSRRLSSLRRGGGVTAPLNTPWKSRFRQVSGVWRCFTTNQRAAMRQLTDS